MMTNPSATRVPPSLLSPSAAASFQQSSERLYLYLSSQASNGRLLASVKAHAKYLVRVLWAPGLGGEGGDRGEGPAGSCGLITCSADQSVGFYHWQPRTGGKEGAAAAEEELSGSLIEIKRVGL